MQLWKINLEKRRKARKFANELLLRSCVKSWCVETRQRKENNEMMCLMKQKRNEKLVSDIGIVVVVVITPPLPRDGGTARTAIQVHAVNLIEIRLGERWQHISNQS